MTGEQAKMELIQMCPQMRIILNNHWFWFNKEQKASYEIIIATAQNVKYIEVQAGTLNEAMNLARQAIMEKKSSH